jgi:hypothetical protein
MNDTRLDKLSSSLLHRLVIERLAYPEEPRFVENYLLRFHTPLYISVCGFD